MHERELKHKIGSQNWIRLGVKNQLVSAQNVIVIIKELRSIVDSN